jgi:thiol-disulfide isomerase/thioredoxin
MKEKLKHYLKETVLFIFVMTLFANALSFYKSQSLNKDPLVLTTHQLIDKTLYSVPKNKAVLVHFWATWCPTCKLEADNIARIAKDFEVITIAVKSKTDKEILRYLHARGLDFKVINDADGKLSKQFHIEAFPTTFIYDKNHNLQFSEVGYTSTLGLYLRMLWVSL